MIKEIINAYGADIIGTILVAILGILGMAVKRIAQRWLDTNEKQLIAKQAVRFVEQCFQDLHGHEKLEQALNTAAAMLGNKGIKFDTAEMEIMIEAAVNEFNEQAQPKALLSPDTEAAVRKHYEYYTPACGEDGCHIDLS